MFFTFVAVSTSRVLAQKRLDVESMSKNRTVWWRGVLARCQSGLCGKAMTKILINNYWKDNYYIRERTYLGSNHQLKTGGAEVRPRWTINAKSSISILDTNDLIVIQ